MVKNPASGKMDPKQKQAPAQGRGGCDDRRTDLWERPGSWLLCFCTLLAHFFAARHSRDVGLQSPFLDTLWVGSWVQSVCQARLLNPRSHRVPSRPPQPPAVDPSLTSLLSSLPRVCQASSAPFPALFLADFSILQTISHLGLKVPFLFHPWKLPLLELAAWPCQKALLSEWPPPQGSPF